MPTPEIATDNLVKLAKKIAWSPHSGLTHSTRTALRQAVDAYEREKQRPTSFDHIMADDDPYEKEPSVSRCAYSKCMAPMMSHKHGRRKYHSEECRKKAFQERKKAGLVKSRPKKGLLNPLSGNRTSPPF